ncbi:tetraacyldisaccharide 4'-kinase [Geobacter sp.]|uniref:tetraacyldisaccharide 4'-kinase n=1 Tax=Geobacter sp. TaxID=46610 RepID=UPI00261C0655|nr:tetraacyldisaccharide 4'-kinase [Geobacter sp.]
MERYYRELVEGRRRSVFDRLLLLLLSALSYPYALAVRVRAALYAAGILPSRCLPRKVVSVGNLTVGGTGKTPMVAWIARYFLARGKRVAVISRGYGGTAEGKTRIVSDGETLFLTPEEAGDEPYLLARSVPGLMVVIGADRHAAGLLAIERLSPELFILDDGFQHLRLRRDLNILLLDCRSPFGNGRTLPAGLLREPTSAASRADVVVLTRCGGVQREGSPVAGLPCSRVTHRLTAIVPLAGGTPVPFSMLKGERVLAFSGIADPISFFTALKGEGVELAATLSFPDHARYGKREIDTICQLKNESGAAFLVTTEKDAVKLGAYADLLGGCFSVPLEMEFLDSRALEKGLEKLMQL